MTITEKINKVFDSYAEIAQKQPEALSLLHSVYKELFGEGVKKECGDCNVKAFRRIQKYISLQKQSNDNFNLETMKKFKDRNFALKQGKVLTIAFTADAITNDNMTDEKAIDILSRYPNFLKYFDKYPGSDTPSKELDLSLVKDFSKEELETTVLTAVKGGKKTEQDAITDKVNTPPHKRGRGANALEPLNPGEDLKDYADRIKMSHRNVLRRVDDIPNYDPETKKGRVDTVIEPEVVKQPLSLVGLLNEKGLSWLNAEYDIEALEAGLSEIEDPEAREADTLQVARFFNSEMTDEAEIAETSEHLAVFLKTAEGDENKASEDPEAPANSEGQETADKSTQPAPEGPATV